MDLDEQLYISKEEHTKFLSEKDYNKKLKILLIHSKKNKLRIERRNIMLQENKTQEQFEQEMLELNQQFSDFLHAKGLKAKFKLAFSNMKASAKKQHEADKAQLNAVKQKSAQENKEFVEFLHTKGFKAKCRLVIDNIKKSAAEAPKRTAANIAKVKAQTQANIAKVKAQTQANIAKVNSYNKPIASSQVTADDLAREFNEFLKSKGLDSEFKVVNSNEIE